MSDETPNLIAPAPKPPRPPKPRQSVALSITFTMNNEGEWSYGFGNQFFCIGGFSSFEAAVRDLQEKRKAHG